MLNFTRILSARDLQKEKKKDYRNIVLLQILMVGMGLLLSELLDPVNYPALSKIVTLIMSAFAAVYSFLLWDLLRNFTRNTRLIRIIFIVISLVVLSGIITEFPYYKLITIENRNVYLLVLHSMVFMVEITVISYTLIDVFSGKFLTSDKLWGAACVYLMIGIAFASLFDILNFLIPGCMGVNLVLGLPSYSECIYHSFSILGGVDSIYSSSISLVRNFGVIESVWGNLFVVLIIGKLLSMPLEEEKN